MKLSSNVKGGKPTGGNKEIRVKRGLTFILAKKARQPRSYKSSAREGSAELLK
jgi:hypothetical protein